jgi:hypothetical protein
MWEHWKVHTYKAPFSPILDSFCNPFINTRRVKINRNSQARGWFFLWCFDSFLHYLYTVAPQSQFSIVQLLFSWIRQFLQYVHCACTGIIMKREWLFFLPKWFYTATFFLLFFDLSLKGTQDWDFFLLRFWNLYYFFVSHVKILRFYKKKFGLGHFGGRYDFSA